VDSDDTVEAGIVRTSLASIESTGYVKLCRCHQFRRLKSESNWVIVSLSRYDDNSDIAAAVDDTDIGVVLVDWEGMRISSPYMSSHASVAYLSYQHSYVVVHSSVLHQISIHILEKS
jgi:hypothetical protein